MIVTGKDKLKNLRDILIEKLDDPEARAIYERLLTCDDLVEAEARVHYECNRAAIVIKKNKRPSIGRPSELTKLELFNQLCTEIECSPTVYSASEAHALMLSYADGNEDQVYSRRYILDNLKLKYGEHLLVCSKDGRSNLLCFRNMADFLITDSWYDKRKQEVEDEATRVVKQAAKLLISSMKDMDYTKDKYPLGKDVSDIDKCLTWLPDLVQTFLATLINNKLQRAGIGQALVGATIPRSCLPPLLFAIGADIDHVLATE